MVLGAYNVISDKDRYMNVDIATGKKKPSNYPPQFFTKTVGIGWLNW